MFEFKDTQKFSSSTDDKDFPGLCLDMSATDWIDLTPFYYQAQDQLDYLFKNEFIHSDNYKELL